MKKLIPKYSVFKILAENIRFLFCLACRQIEKTAINSTKLRTFSYNLSTAIPQKLWKSCKNPVHLNTCIILLFVLLLVSCNPFKSTKPNQPTKSDQSAKTDQKNRRQPPMENAIISMTENEVRKKLGEPDIVSKTPENNIVWTYRDAWKIMPNNKGTFYIEFENDKVIKVIKAR